MDALRIALLVLLVVISSLILYRERIFSSFRIKERQSHDLAVFRALDQLLAETDIEKLLDDLAGEHIAYMDSVKKLYDLRGFAEKEGNKFLDTRLDRDFHSFYLSVVSLSDFMYKYFAKYPADQGGDINFRIALTPYFNFERGAAFSPENNQQYEEKEKAMKDMMLAFKTKYQVFRRNVKQRLIV